MAIQVKRVYEAASQADGVRVLVDRLWPRGLAKATARIDIWARDVAPSEALRRWYGHEPDRWPEFRRRYFAELDVNRAALNSLLEAARGGTVTLLYGSKETRLNNAVALKDYLESLL
ncbi:MAG TPA: DUF488 family protein [Nevskiales bacterium]|nr:DUF488 family protein [Nevskiales bacterium]